MVKPGILTSEFWLGAAYAVVNLLVMTNVINVQAGTAVDASLKGVADGVVGIFIGIYAIVRTFHKTKALPAA